MAMHDELGDEIFKALMSTHLFSRSYPELMRNEGSRWWDNRNTPLKTETRQHIFLEAFLKSVGELESNGDQQWGDVHTMEHPHPLGTIDLLRPYFNVGPFSAPGGRETINNASFNLNPDGKYEISYGPAMRRIINFADAENAVSILPTGNSGNPMSPHFKDQSELFVSGQFRKMMMNEAEIKQSANHLIIRP
jgi:penicillin amidase